jgi:hypothetical protein
MSRGNWFMTRNIMCHVLLSAQCLKCVKTSTTLQPKPENWHCALFFYGLDQNLCPFFFLGIFLPVTHLCPEECSPSFKGVNKEGVLK